MREDLQRVAVIGTSCAGKTTVARRLAQRLGQPAIELDAIHWGPGWQPASLEEFRAAVAAATAEERWVVDGNYSEVRDLVWARATAVVWLDLAFPVIFRRALQRTLRRIVTREELFSGNRETVRQGLLSWDGIPCWVIRTHRRRRRQYRTLLAEERHEHLRVFPLRRQAEVETFFEALDASSSRTRR
jgi:adenylate kinase family enzyme